MDFPETNESAMVVFALFCFIFFRHRNGRRLWVQSTPGKAWDVLLNQY